MYTGARIKLWQNAYIFIYDKGEFNIPAQNYVSDDSYTEAAIEADPENEALIGQRTFFENQVERTQLNASFVDRLRQGRGAADAFLFFFFFSSLHSVFVSGVAATARSL